MSDKELTCSICQAKIFMAIGKSGGEYKANKFDKSPHNTKKPDGSTVCVTNWDDFKAVRMGKAVAEKIDVSDTVTKGLSEKPPTLETKFKPKELSAADFTLVKIRGEAKTNLIILLALKQEVDAFWKRNNLPENGQEKGMWFKELRRMSKNL